MKTLINTGPSQCGWHSLEDALLCPRRYWLAHVSKDPRHGSSEENMYRLDQGTWAHLMQAHHFAQRLGCDVEYFSLEEVIDRLDIDPKDKAHQKEVFNFVKTTQIGWPERVVAVEKEYFGDCFGFAYSARIDLTIIGKDGRVYFVDHKTCEKPGLGSVAQTYYSHGQIIGQWWLGEQNFGGDFGGVVLQMIKINKPYAAARFAVPVAPGRVKAHPYVVRRAMKLKTALQAVKDIRDATPTPTRTTCHFTHCPFEDICRWE